MKKILFVLIMLFTVSITTTAQDYKLDGNTFISSTGEVKAKADIVKTKYNWQDSKGKYPIYININTGTCFVFKTSTKTNKEYKKYMASEICQKICKEYKVEYKAKKK